MNPIIKNVLVVIAGLLGGSFINMGLVQLGHKVFPMVGVDFNNMEELATILPTLEAKYFIFPFLAHALGTLVGAFIAARIAANNKMKFAMIIGGLFLLGGIMINLMLSGPTWFSVIDILFAYIPMAYIGGKLTERIIDK